MIRKSVKWFSEKIMLKQGAKAAKTEISGFRMAKLEQSMFAAKHHEYLTSGFA
jgi:hypothetical protein